jgi:hypothetical protein
MTKQFEQSILIAADKRLDVRFGEQPERYFE